MNNENTNKPEKLLKKSYLCYIRNSVGTRMFRNFYLKDNGAIFDATENGKLSCAFYVSGLLRIFNLIGNMHGTVASTEKDMIASGWVQTNNPTPGCVIIWGLSDDSGGHKHIGFYIGRNIAISNSTSSRKISRHDWQYGGKRKISAIYNHPSLRH